MMDNVGITPRILPYYLLFLDDLTAVTTARIRAIHSYHRLPTFFQSTKEEITTWLLPSLFNLLSLRSRRTCSYNGILVQRRVLRRAEKVINSQ
jgi:hypothetical protein